MNPLTDVLSAKARKTAYTIYALIGVAFGAVQVGYSQGANVLPDWFATANAVYLFLGVAFGLTAASNITKPDPQDELAE